MSNITKKALGNELKSLMLKKNINQISITELVNQCGLNRQTFYYHFADIYDLLQWIYQNEILLDENMEYTLENWCTILHTILINLKHQEKFVLATVKSLPLDKIEGYVFKAFYEALYYIFTSEIDLELSDQDKMLICKFYSYAFTGIVIDWIAEGFLVDIDDMMAVLQKIMNHQLIASATKVSIN